jgi:hypothetical protein
MNNHARLSLLFSTLLQIIFGVGWFLKSPIQGPPFWWSVALLVLAVGIAIWNVRILLSSVSETVSENLPPSLSILDFFALYLTVILGFTLIYEKTYDECWNLKNVCEEEPFRLNSSMEIDEVNKVVKELIKNGEMAVVVQEHEKLLAAEKRAEKEAKLQCMDPAAVEFSVTMTPMPPKITCFTDMDSYQNLFKLYTQGINQKYIDKFNAIQKSVETKRRLTYVDFLYFSTVTSGTVGYGDILPNSTKTKLFVIIQICINLFLTLVLFNLLLSNENRKTKKTLKVDNKK